jgi:hypothetical protein
MDESRGLLSSLVGDGRPLLTLTGVALLFSGAFAVFLSATGQFLPHDIDFLQASAGQLCAQADCRIVAFMFHDRVAFGGALLAVAILYLWLSAFPLRAGEAWAWWTFAISGSLGFLSFLAYLAYGYLDTWHGVGTLFLLPCFLAGLVLSHRTLVLPAGMASMREGGRMKDASGRGWWGRALLLVTAAGMVLAGLTILFVGMTEVFVPQDLQYMGLDRDRLHAINPRLIPLIAHDRAGFGGGLATAGIVVGLCTYCGRPTPGLWQALFLAGTAGFGCAIGVHYRVGYTDYTHLAPALVGAGMFAVGISLSYGPMVTRREYDRVTSEPGRR